MRKNKLYTVNQWNKPFFDLERKNLFSDGTPPQGLDIARQQANAQAMSSYANSTNAFGVSKADNPFSKMNMARGLKGMASGAKNLVGGFGAGSIGGGMLGAVGQAVGKIGGDLIAGGLKSGAGSAISNIGGAVGGAISNVNPVLGAAVSAATGIIGGGVSALFGSAVDEEKLKAAKEGTEELNKFTSNATSIDDLSGPQAVANVEDAYRGGVFTKGAAAKKNRALKEARADARNFAFNSVENNAENLADDQMNDQLANFAAFGGELGTNGADFTNGLLQINEGGTHAQNPYDGVPMGVDSEGVPNLVEEGETIYNNYVFSDRIKVPTSVCKELGLGKDSKKGLTYAEASKKLAKESEQRPNDSISRAGLDTSLSRLAETQEFERQKKNSKEYMGLAGYCNGGKLGHKFEDGGVTFDPLVLKQGLYPPSLSTENSVLTPKAQAALERDLMKGIKQKKTGSKSYSTWMRYAPIAGSGTLALTDMLGITNKPDYSNIASLEAAAEGAGYAPNVSYTPLGDYMRYSPFDRQYYLNQLQANSRATDRALINRASPSRAAELLASGYNTTLSTGNLARQAEEYNREQYEKTKEFNRKTNMFNSQTGLEAAMANARFNQQAASTKLSGLAQAAALRDAIDKRTSAARAANLSNFLTALGNLGKENFIFNQINSDKSRGYSVNKSGQSEYKRNK